MVEILSADETIEGANDAGYAVPEPNIPPYEPPKNRTPIKERFTTFYETNPVPVKALGGALALFLLVVLPIFFVWSFYFKTEPIEVTAQSFTWGRQIEVEKYKVIHESGWSYPPRDAYDVDRDYRYHYSREVLDHYETDSYSCGTTDAPRTCTRSRAVYRSEAVYDWYYSYLIDRWRTERWLITGGTDQKPFWAEIPAAFSNVNEIGNEREGNEHKEVYTIHVVDEDGRVHLNNESQFVWENVQVGERGRGAITRKHKLRGVTWRTE